MADYRSLISMAFKKASGFLGYLKNFFSRLWDETPKISYTEEKVLLSDPHIDVFENDKEFHITAHVPGLEKNDIHIELNKGILSLRGTKKIEKEETYSTYHIIEHASVYFNHTVQLPSGIDEDDVEAVLKDGVIDIALSKLPGAHSIGSSTKTTAV